MSTTKLRPPPSAAAVATPRSRPDRRHHGAARRLQLVERHASPTTARAASPASTVATSVAAAPTTAVPNGHVDLTFSGAINAHVVGTSATSVYYVPSTHYGLVYEVNGAQNGHPEIGDLQLSAVSATATPAVILNPPGASFLRHENDGTVTLAADRTHASIDATLKTVTSDRSVHVSGTIACG